MATQTPNFSFDLPVVGADDDIWGGFLNGNWSSLDDLLLALQQAVLPIGAILMWSGTIATIPAGFGLCNGSSYTRTDGAGSISSPNMTARFVVGSTGDAVGDYPTNNQGGGAQGQTFPVDVTVDVLDHVLTAGESGGHTHTGISPDVASVGGALGAQVWNAGVNGLSVYVAGTTGPGVQSVDGNDPHDHNATATGEVDLSNADLDPAWFSLAYIMKI